MKYFSRFVCLPHRDGFSLVEVVLALGVISFAIVAILGVFPVGLATGHAAQDETRAPQIAQSIFGALAAQNVVRDASGQPVLDGDGHLQLNSGAKIPGIANAIDLTSSTPVLVYANNNGEVSDSAGGATHAVSIELDSSPAGFDPPSGTEFFANQVTLRVMSPAVPNQGPTPTPNQRVRSFIRIISKY